MPELQDNQPSKPREWWLRKNFRNNEAYLFDNKPEELDAPWENIHVIEYTALQERDALLSDMIDRIENPRSTHDWFSLKERAKKLLGR